MKDSIKCCIVSMGIGFVLGAVITANNKKAMNAVKGAQDMAIEKIEMAKEGLETLKEKMEEKIEEGKEAVKNSSQNKKAK